VPRRQRPDLFPGYAPWFGLCPCSLLGQLDDLRAEQNGREIEISIGDLPSCEADPSLLKQVYVNLISNAIKYTQKREVAKIEIGCRNGTDGSHGREYFVKDNGVGFDMKYADKLFGVFQRLHRAEEFEGTGVGLAIVQRIINRHGGRIWADAELFMEGLGAALIQKPYNVEGLGLKVREVLDARLNH